MENWNLSVFLKRLQTKSLQLITLSLLAFPTAYAAENSVQVIEPEIDRRTLETKKIDSENFEIGFYVGTINIDDFGGSDLTGLRAAYHISESFFFEATYGQATVGLTSFEILSGGLPLFTDEEREFTHYDLSLGWNIFPGESFLFGSAFNSNFYLLGGAGSTEFLGSSWFTVTYGAGYRLFLNDWIAWHIDARNHLFDRDTFGEEVTTSNVEMTTGFTIFF